MLLLPACLFLRPPQPDAAPAAADCSSFSAPLAAPVSDTEREINCFCNECGGESGRIPVVPPLAQPPPPPSSSPPPPADDRLRFVASPSPQASAEPAVRQALKSEAPFPCCTAGVTVCFSACWNCEKLLQQESAAAVDDSSCGSRLRLARQPLRAVAVRQEADDAAASAEGDAHASPPAAQALSSIIATCGDDDQLLDEAKVPPSAADCRGVQFLGVRGDPAAAARCCGCSFRRWGLPRGWT